jgi:hypothetical protein
MGEAKRKRLAGYIPEPRVQESPNPRKIVVGSGASHMALIAALLAQYPKLPEEVKRHETNQTRITT